MGDPEIDILILGSPIVTVFYCIWYKESSAENIDFWFTHLQMDYEAHIWWFWRVHEYSSSTEYEGLTPTRNRFIDDLIFCPTMVFSYNEMMLGFHPWISLEIRPDITKMEKYLNLGFSMRCSRPHDPTDLQLSSPNSPCNYPNDVDTSLLFFCIFLSPANMLCWTSSYVCKMFTLGARNFAPM